MLATAATLAAGRLALTFSATLGGFIASATAATAALLVLTTSGASACKFVEH